MGRLQLCSWLLLAHSLPFLSTFSRRISVLDVAGADVSPSLPVLWACKLGNPVSPSVMQGLGGCSTIKKCFGSRAPLRNVSKGLVGWFGFPSNEMAFLSFSPL